MILKNAMIHVGDGTVRQGDIRIRAGKIAEVGNNLEGTDVRDLTGLDIFPGFMDAGNFLGTQDMAFYAHDWNENSSPITPYLDVWHSLDPDELSIQELYKAGITSMVVSPGNDNILGGTCAVVKTKGKNINKITVRRDVALKAAFMDHVIDIYKTKGGPKTPMGMASLLSNALADPNEGTDFRSRRTHLIMEQVKRGDIPILVACDPAVQMLRFLDVVKPYPDMKVIFTLSYQADRIADQLKERNAAVILGDSSRSSLHCHYQMNYGQLRKMADDGLPFGLTLLGPDMSWGRETVFWNVSRLLQGEEDKETAVKMLTVNPAEMFGVSDRIGAIKEGLDADLLIYRGNPFEKVNAVLLETMIEGETVFSFNGEEA